MLFDHDESRPGVFKKRLFYVLPLFFCLMLCLILSGCRSVTVLDASALDDEEPAAGESAEAAPELLSLRDAGLETVRLYLDGRQYSGLRVGGTVWVECRDLAERFSGFRWQEEGDRLLLSDRDGHQAALSGRGLREGEAPSETDAALILRYPDGSASECWVSLSSLTEALYFRSLFDGADGTYYLSPSVDTSLIPQGASVPVLMYHGVSDQPWGLEGLFMTPAQMREHVRFLTENGYDPIFFSDLTHLEDYDKPVLITFDDGYNDNFSELYPILQEFQAKATIFMIAHNVDYNPNFMTGAQLRELADSGLVEIHSHTVNHLELASLSEEEQLAEMRDSQLMLARSTGRVSYVLSYPAGKYNDATLRLGPDYYDFGVKSRDGLWTVAENFFEIDRFPVYRGAGAGDLQALLPY